MSHTMRRPSRASLLGMLTLGALAMLLIPLSVSAASRTAAPPQGARLTASNAPTPTVTPQSSSSTDQQVTVYVHAGPTSTPVPTKPSTPNTPVATATASATATSSATATETATASATTTPHPATPTVVAKVLPVTGLFRSLPGGPVGSLLVLALLLLAGAGVVLRGLRRA